MDKEDIGRFVGRVETRLEAIERKLCQIEKNTLCKEHENRLQDVEKDIYVWKNMLYVFSLIAGAIGASIMKLFGGK